MEYSARNETAVLEQIETDSIAASNLNPRKWIQQEPLEELAASIREHGILEPLVVRPVTPAGARGLETPIVELASGGVPKYQYRYELIAGERRWRAARMVGLATVPAVVRYDVADDHTTLQLMMVENLQRSDLDPIEEAQGYKRLGELGMRQREIAEQVHKSQPAVANAMRLLDLPADVQLRIRKGELTPAHGRAIAAWSPFPEVASQIAGLAAEKGWTTRETEKPFRLHYWDIMEPLRKAGLVRNLGDATFERKLCLECPHDAYRNPDTSYGLCFRPQHFDELNAAAWEEKKRRLQDSTRLLSISTDGTTEVLEPPKISDLNYGTYERLARDVPPGCQETCQSRGRAKEGARFVPICLDPKCYKRLTMAETKRKNKTGRDLMAVMLLDLEQRIDALMEIGPREMSVIGTAVMANDWHLRGYLREAAERQYRLELWNKLDGGYSTEAYRAEALEDVYPLAVAQIIVEGFCRMELVERYKERSRGESPTADWYLKGDPAAVITTTPTTTGATPATHRCASYPAECDRQCAWSTGEERYGYPAYCLKFDPVPLDGADDPSGENSEPGTQNPEPAPAECEAYSAWAVTCRLADGSARMWFPCEDHKEAALKIGAAHGDVKSVYELTPGTGKGKLKCHYGPPAAVAAEVV